jgi:hypothetical protein
LLAQKERARQNPKTKSKNDEARDGCGETDQRKRKCEEKKMVINRRTLLRALSSDEEGATGFGSCQFA